MIRLQVRKSVYRGRPGFLVCGTIRHHTDTKIFFDHEKQARDFVFSLKRGNDSESTLKRIWNIN